MDTRRLNKADSIAISGIIEKLKHIASPRDFSALSEAISELESKQVELQQQNEELANAYKSLEQLYEKYSDLYDSAPVGYLTFDHRLMVMEANKTAELLMQKSKINGPLVGTSFLHRLSKESHEKFLTGLTRARRKQSEAVIEVEIVTKQTTPLSTELTIRPIFDEDGSKLKWYSVIVADISLRKQQLRMIEEQRAQLISTTKLSVLGEVAAGIAHEINNPLAIIVLRATQLRAAAEKDPATLTDAALLAAEKIESTAFRISKIVSALLKIARGGTNDPIERAPLKQILDDAIALCEARYQRLGVELKVQSISGALQVDCRAVQLSQVILNLLNNALDASKGSHPSWVELSVEDASNQVIIHIADSGQRIKTDVKEKMFEPFFTTKPINEGSGLGLSVSRSLVENHGGTLTLESIEPNTSFRIEIPKHLH